ncbi:MAG TPA: ATP-binding protein [Puia sp.]|nr:ATP-binding protein [Puia sp.]
MKRISVLWALLIFSLANAGAQRYLPPPYPVSNDTTPHVILPDSCIRILNDKNDQWSVRDVELLAESGRFHPFISANGNKDTPVRSYWFMYRLKNTMTTAAKISLNSLSDVDEFYVSGQGTEQAHYTTGNLSDLKDGLKWINCIPIKLKAGETITVYQHVSNTRKGLPVNFNIAFFSTETVIQNGYVDSIDSGQSIYTTEDLESTFMIGLLILAAFFNLFFFSVTREKMYIYFSLFALFLAINRMYDIANYYFTVHKASWIAYLPIFYFAWAFIHVFLIQFIRHFFKVKTKYPRWDRFLLILALLSVLSHAIRLAGALVTHDFSDQWLSLFAPLFQLIPLAVIITFFLYIRERNMAYRFLIVGAFPLMLLYLLERFWLIPIKFLAAFKKLELVFRPIEVCCIIWLILFFSWTLFMRYNQLRKENAQKDLDKERMAREKEMERSQLIEDQKISLEKTVETRTAELKRSLDDLQATQKQLIQAEKMASLGELTAGIAHEIQNPLNFVNNFSDLNKELLFEMNEEIDKDNFSEVKSLARDVMDNEEKINHHGKRADAIVKAMLQHSQSGTGAKEPVDINAIAGECLKLSYQSFRSKDKSFQAKLQTDFDNSIQKIPLIQQDIVRVLVNVFNNAFYAVNEKWKAASRPAGGASVYEPVVSVSTNKSDNNISITVRDNGNGIPQKIMDKIFQPFFTTKPTGEGTGLGLSLSYDIIKALGGEIKVETKQGEYSAFIIVLA